MKIEEIKGYLGTGVKFKDIPKGYDGIRELDVINFDYCLVNGKLILRPLSDLTENYVSQFILDKLSKCSSKDIKQCLSYNEIDCLLKHHFDIHGLIEKGEAIDINTL